MNARNLLQVLSIFALACGGTTRDGSTQGGNENATSLQPESAKPELVTSVWSPAKLAAAAGRVYVTTKESLILGEHSDSGSLFLLGQPGSEPMLLASDKFGSAFGALAADAEDVVWATADGRVLSIPARGGVVKTLSENEGIIPSIALSDTHVYFASENNNKSILKRVVRSGGVSEVHLAGLARVRGIAVSGNALYLADQGSGANDGKIYRVERVSGIASVIAEGQSEPCGVALANGSRDVIWTNGGESAQAAKSLAGFSAIAGSASCALTSDGELAFFGLRTGDAVLKASIRTGSSSLWTQGANASGLGAMAVSSEHVYWLSGESILRARK
jgi:DNA-binding beta-propeller fold protein YncE